MNESLPTQKFQLKKLSAKHKQVAALLAQGIGRAQIAQLVGITPEYVTMLGHQPVFVEYVRQMTRFTDVRMEALFDKAVDTIADTLVAGSEDARLRASQMVLRATGKEGTHKVDATVQHNVSLVGLLRGLPPARRSPVTVDQERSNLEHALPKSPEAV